VAAAPPILTRIVTPRISLDQIYLGAMPFVWIILLEMALLYLWPEIALWLPGLLAR
jgi:TRAP-type mannitol/chloroaromatic compound transport system permease large subunit